jgi:AraC-like DNA-binding protein
MLVPKVIHNWLSKIQYKFFNYKDGFFHIKSLSNSPHTLLKSFDSMPFMKHDKKKGKVGCNTPIINSNIYYCELQEGLWLMVSRAENKFNFIFHNIFENEKEEYYFINLHFSDMDIKFKQTLVNSIPLPTNTWSVLKPKANKNITHFKNTIHRNITLYFRKDLLKSRISPLKFIDENKLLDTFLKSDNQYLLAQDAVSREYLYEEFIELMKIENELEKKEKIKEKLNYFFKLFISNYENNKLDEKYFRLKDIDQRNVLEVERILHNNIFEGFPGIEFLANRVGISAAKLKNDFKTVHEISLYQYFRKNQMELAYSILENKSLKIGQIANKFGYENSSKFSSAFKETFGLSPSDLLKK